MELIDLPGVYSLSPHSEDEQVAYDVLTGRRQDTAKPEAILLVLDSTNLSRHLMLAAPILALGLPTLIILNMADDLRSRGGTLDTKALSRELGAPVALVSARQGEGLEQVCRVSRRRHGAACAQVAAGAARRSQVPRVGRPGGQPGRLPRAHRRPSGRAAWIACSCIRWPGR